MCSLLCITFAVYKSLLCVTSLYMCLFYVSLLLHMGFLRVSAHGSLTCVTVVV